MSTDEMKFRSGEFFFNIHLKLIISYNTIFLCNHENYVRLKMFFLFKGQVIITTLPPISTEGLTAKDVPNLIEKTRLLMIEVFQSTNQETLSITLNSKKDS